jgi:chemotaxis protein MotA
MDLGTIFGITFGLFAIALAIVIGNSGDVGAIGNYVDGPSVFIVIGGTMAAMFISHPAGDLKRLMSVTMQTLKTRNVNTYELIERVVQYSDLARRNGLLSIEHAMEPTDDPFLRRGLRYAVDGMDRDQIKESMEAELESIMTRHEGGKKFFDNIKDFGPAFGMLGTLIGLVGMLKNLSDPKAIGPNMAVALLTTMYGTLLANFVGGPISNKLAIRNAEERINKEIIIQGVLGIQAGENPRALKSRLLIYLAPKVRGGEEE